MFIESLEANPRTGNDRKSLRRGRRSERMENGGGISYRSKGALARCDEIKVADLREGA